MKISQTLGARAPAAKGSAKEDNQLLRKLTELWVAYSKRSLAVRREMGSLLNVRLGLPTERQSRGRGVLKQASKMLEIAVSELNRMRWFAHLSKDDESCWGETPQGSRTWSQFKKLLPTLIAAAKGNERRQRSSGEKKTAVIDGILRLIRSATSNARTGNFTVDGAKKREELVEGLRDLVSAVL
jgi:hypothetical protein